jgi:hypothetical protein
VRRAVNNLVFIKPVKDEGWRVALHPAGTTLDAAMAAEAAKQTSAGRAIDPAVAPRILPRYWVRNTAESLPDEEKTYNDHGWRDVVAVLGVVAVRYRVTGPDVHNP